MSRTRHHRIPQRKRIFIGCEGESERSYAALLQQLLGNRAEFHLVAEVLNGGDPYALLESAEKALRREHTLARDPFVERFVILDSDLRGRSVERDGLCIRLARKLNIQLIWQEPCHEAVLLRHLLNCEQRRPPTTRESEEQLRVQWPGYVKNFGRDRLSERIDKAALLRVNRHEPDLAVLLKLIKLIE
ncbi:RloB domain-containing protein [Paraburkholderia sp. SEWSISQ10-3 4]|uniref:RloB domain-containing protein n=1 Tax=Paraburkholderia TaxID=1822464 RepID=UPI003461A0B7